MAVISLWIAMNWFRLKPPCWAEISTLLHRNSWNFQRNSLISVVLTKPNKMNMSVISQWIVNNWFKVKHIIEYAFTGESCRKSQEKATHTHISGILSKIMGFICYFFRISRSFINHTKIADVVHFVQNILLNTL